MKQVCLALLLFTSFFYAQSQTAKLPQVIGPSPEVATMQKYGDYKVSTYTGVPDITLPIYTMQVNDITVPISISYHGGGIRVDEESSRVGLGWTLNAGGTISRNILGLDDLSPYSFAPNSFDLFGFPVYSVVNQLTLDLAAHMYDVSGKVGLTVDPSMPFISLDLEPDEFYCNFLGINNKFILQKNDTSVVFEDPSMNMKVKFNITPYPINDGTPAGNAGVDCKIQVTTDDGTVYYFDKFETCKTTSPNSDIPTRITAWYLTKIQTIKGTVVNFNYTQAINAQTYSLNHLSVSKDMFSAAEPVISYIPHSTYWTLYLSSITSSNCNVYFNYDTRLDLNGDKRLTSIQVKDGSSAVIKTVNLIQDYFTANSSASNSYNVQAALWGGPALDTNWLYKRLKLTELKEMSADSQTSRSHFFEYNDSLLPLKNTTSRDHYGFFNNAANGQNLIPNIYWAYPGLIAQAAGGVYNCSPASQNDFSNSNIFYIESPHKSYWSRSGANREVDTNYTRAFILNKITYPTGGFTKFDFEQNTFDRGKSYASDFAAPYYNYEPQSDSVAFIAGIPGIPVGYTQSFTFTVTAKDTLPGEGNVALLTFQLYGLRQGGNTSSSTAPTTVELINSSNVQLVAMGFNNYTGLISNGDGTFSPSAWVNQRLPVGTYTLKFTFGGNIVDKNSPFYRLIATWSRPEDNAGDGVRYKLGGGIRIRNISNYTSTGVLATSMDYIYHFSADSNNNGIPEIYSTGKAMDRPHYFEGNLAGPFTVYLTSDANCSSGVGYDSVITLQNKIRHLEAFNNTCYRSNLYNTHNYSTSEMMPVGYAPLAPRFLPGIGLPNDQLNQDILFDNRPSGIKDFKDNANGRLTKSVDYLYDSVTAKYKVIKLIQNTYTYTGTGIQGIIWADRMIAASNGVFYNCLKGLPPIYGLTSYFYPALRSVAVLPAMTIEKTYSGTDSLSDTTTYTYSLNNQLKTKTSINSKGDSLVESYSYPLDFSGVTAGTSLSNAIISLKNKNVLAPVIERFVQRKSSSGALIGTIQATITSFKPTNNLPDTIWAAEFTQPSTTFTPLNTSATTPIKDAAYRPQMIFSKYDTAGNIVAQQRYRDVNNVYLWNYSNSYPVCQVTNADSADIAYTSFETDNPGNWVLGNGGIGLSGGITGARYFLPALGGAGTISKGGLNAARNYIVTYWSKSGSLTVNGATTTSSLTKGNWSFYSHKLAAGATSVTITGGSIPIDELRLLPVDAQMTTYTFQPLVGMTSQCDAAGKVIYYEYDGLQRLQRIKDLDGNILKQFEYKYQVSVN